MSSAAVTDLLAPLLTPLLAPLLLGMDWMDPEWLMERFGEEFLWVSLLMLLVECGLFFPFLPGDTLLFALGIFIATEQIDIFPGPPAAELSVAMGLMVVAAFLGNVAGYEIGRAIGPPLYHREGRLLRKEYFDQTSAFFDKHGNKALVIGRFVPFVRTFITVVAGVTRMSRRRFFLWSLVGAVLWVLSITVLGYALGNTVPWLGDNIDYAIIAILVFGSIPMLWELRRHRRGAAAAAATQASPASSAAVPAPAPEPAGEVRPRAATAGSSGPAAAPTSTPRAPRRR